MLIALSSTFIVLSIILLVSFLWERKKCLRIQKRLFRESRKLDRTNHITSAILKNVHAYILLIDNDFKVLKTNYYQKTGTRKGLEEKEWVTCYNAVMPYPLKEVAARTIFCGSCPIRFAIRQAFEHKKVSPISKRH